MTFLVVLVSIYITTQYDSLSQCVQVVLPCFFLQCEVEPLTLPLALEDVYVVCTNLKPFTCPAEADGMSWCAHCSTQKKW